MSAPLTGIRVLDLTNVLAGPYCGYQLALLGAEVVKVEEPRRGDLARQLGADPALNRRLLGASFLAQNAGKKSVALDLKRPAGRAAFLRLVATADVLLENFRPGVMDRLGLGYETLARERPDLVYCAISGFGQTGPLRDAPAYDQVVQGLSGVMSLTGDAGSAPLRVGFPVCDTLGGLAGAFAVAAALVERSRTGRGRRIDVSLLEATVSALGWPVSNLLLAGVAPQPMGNDNFTASPSGAFRTADGPLNVAANRQEQFEALCEVIGRPELPRDPRFADREARLRHRAALTGEIEAALARDGAAAWEARLVARGVPAGRILGLADALGQPQLREREMVFEVPSPVEAGARLPVLRGGFRLDGRSPAVAAPPPRLGEHTEAVLREAGLGDDEIARLRADGAIC
jgi:formyl-CoA transferase